MKDDLFNNTANEESSVDPGTPLAARMRPRSLDEYFGQAHILGPGKLLRRAIESDRLTSIILYGPPGSGKTSLAQIIASTTKCRFERLSGVEGSVADVRRVAASAAFRRRSTGERTILFIDEIHRFNKAQQDVLLPDVESGNLRLIGATTHNPFFYVNSPLVSRSLVFQLEPLSREDLLRLMDSALNDPERGFGNLRVKADASALEFLADVSDGDARRCLNALEIAVLTAPPDADGFIHLNRPVAEESIQKKAVMYDADETEHYDTISAFIKSMRGSDPARDEPNILSSVQHFCQPVERCVRIGSAHAFNKSADGVVMLRLVRVIYDCFLLNALFGHGAIQMNDAVRIWRRGQDCDLQSIQAAPRIAVTYLGKELQCGRVGPDPQIAKSALWILQSRIH